ncbi:glycoside hydrolase family 15 protein [Nocardia farcinica]|uniref:glycoside hydrolase family 15 protein n=1 Tax=Nocardia farcinica TaxID=37329 RepID=UPI00245705DC|nr:glycoside hydrolase family 15 protein [Nocardia farcinica]
MSSDRPDPANPVRATAREVLDPAVLRQSLRVGRADAALAPAVRVGIAAAIALVGFGLAGHQELAGFAALGALTSLYGRYDTYRRRAALLATVGTLMTAAIGGFTLLAALGAPTPVGWLLMATLAGGMTAFVLLLRAGPPGATIVVFCAGAGMAGDPATGDVLPRTGAAATGALLAAATTSLPEQPGGQRNWDYRYTWVRDASFALWGLYTLGLDREADDFFAFLNDATTGPNGEPVPLQVLYGIGGERELTERELPHLAGYDGAQPVRIGNGAYNQEQHDIWGTMLDAVYLHVKSRQQVPEALWPLLERQVDAAIAHWREPDRGIWEVRGEPQHFTSSKVMCWVALDRGAKLAELHGQLERATQWAEIAEEIRTDVLVHGVNEEGVFTQTYGGDTLDASLLLVVLVRFLPPDDHRVRATVLAIADRLTENGLVLRYRTETTDDGLTGAEGAFTICSFWLVSALVEIGEVRRARHLCERLLGFASPLRLYAEEIDPRSGRHLGNFPQAFTHLALINAVTHVIRAENEQDAGGFRPAHSPAHHPN